MAANRKKFEDELKDLEGIVAQIDSGELSLEDSIAAFERGVGLVYAEHLSYPEMADVTADFVYARLQKGSDDIETAYPEDQLDAWAGRLKTWAAGGAPEDLPRVDPGHALKPEPRDVFAYVIHEGKVRAPAAAKALIARTGGT